MNVLSKTLAPILAIGLLALSACGGGGGGGGGDITPPPPPPPPPPSGGITRTGAAVAVGPVTGFGSVIVNGIHYETSNATFSDDDRVITEAELEVGDMVVLKGTIEDDNTNAVAETVELAETVEGPVTEVDTAAGTFVVLGQLVQVTLETIADDNCDGATGTLDDLLGFAVVEVSGPYAQNAAGDVVVAATRYECQLAADPDGFEINGPVSNLDTTARTFTINELLVDYGSVPAVVDDNFPGGAISDGDPVEVKGLAFDGGATPPVLEATKVEYKGNELAGVEGDHLEIEGFITDFVSAEQFNVIGIPVTTIDGTTVFEGGTAADLGDNLKVEVEGEYDADSVLVATKVEIKAAKNVRITGLVDSVDAAAGSFIILGITVTTESVTTRFEDKLNDVEPFGIDGIFAGNYVEARGQEFPAGSGELAAVIVERDDERPETELRGFVEPGGKNRPTLTVLGVTIETNASTEYRNVDDLPMLADDFWNAVAEGSLVDAKGTETSATTLVAEELELEAEDSL